MTALGAMLAARAHREGLAQRASAFRHRHLVEKPIVLLPWHLGAEPFTFAAVAFGSQRGTFDLVVPGEPRDRRLLFPVALDLALWFNRLFEVPWEDRTLVVKGTYERELSTSAPQIWVPNEGALTVLGKLGRRLAYLPTEASPDGPPPADPQLVRFGRHLQFVAAHAGWAGQQMVVAATSLASQNWLTEQTVAERANLAALDAWIDHPPGLHGFDAAAAVEEMSVGPLPAPASEGEMASLIDLFNEARRGGNAAGMARALDQQRHLYTALTAPAWELTWRVLERERRWPEEPRFVADRWTFDIEAYSAHMAWMNGPMGGRRRTRQTMLQAIRSRDQAEQVMSRVEAEEAVSDPIRMIPHLLDHRAVEGQVVDFDDTHSEVKPGNKRATPVPLVTLRTTRQCLVPRGKALWWTAYPDRVRVVVDSVAPDPGGPGSVVVLKVMEHLAEARTLPRGAQPVCFSQLTTGTHWAGKLPTEVPWTHRSPREDDDGDGARSLEADP